MSEEQWARERADVIDEEPPRFGDGREERHLKASQNSPLLAHEELKPAKRLKSLDRTSDAVADGDA